jgi:hypothetical protein
VPAFGSPLVDVVVDAHPTATESITSPRPTAVHRPIMFHLARRNVGADVRPQ